MDFPNRNMLKLLFVFMFFLIFINMGLAIETKENKSHYPNANYELKLNLVEYMIFHNTLVRGMSKYGGQTDFNINVTREGLETYWTIKIEKKECLDMLQNWTLEYSSVLALSVNSDSLESGNEISLKLTRLLNDKIEHSQKNPVYDLIKIKGAIFQDIGIFYIATENGTFRLTGNKIAELMNNKCTSIIARGFIKSENQFELVKFIEKKDKTVELFVMSLCPFSQLAIVSLLDFMGTNSIDAEICLEIRYIFYKKFGWDSEVFTALHGESEVKENLVQMIIRDNYPHFFHHYLFVRATNSEPWENIARKIGIEDEDIKSIALTIQDQKEALIQTEYSYVTRTYQIYDKSPTFVWEGEIVDDITTIEEFEGLNVSFSQSESCSR